MTDHAAAAAIPETISLATVPPLRAELAGGTFLGVTTRKDGTHCAVILLPNKATEQRNWQACVDWAREAGGELPTRSVFHLLRLSATKEELAEGGWYYTADLLSDDTGDEDDAAYAWLCYPGYGHTDNLHKSYEGLAVAVRLIPLTA
ncbi:hypothetical protein PHO31112_00756 [Pandoraea horticolens]|uniref:Uncharacterized protein n=1 Tax=Pandoraea horticolens TaxID=2508298 RepID=A0A5E4SHY6_9BURK|nr:hypothetical protein [Pandoraea horticolens]VVD74392.1 hypothetical protein PHO31112_00756 [Pandoraea horticolens]